ncbi:MAG TPA: FecR domain-containing protein [Gemmatimonadaceae bacterium]|nr:FecR domain-containing protein [Gemmatimonadaceae bacterium]
MTGSSLTNAPVVIGGPLRDEAALESLFRTHFSALCAEAKGHLGEAAESAAPKVVEAAFRQAYDDREHIATEAQLASFLHDAVRRCAARELSRRAGARHLAAGASGAAHHHTAAVTDVDQAWAHLSRQLHPEATRAEAAAYTEQLRHHAAEHVGDLSKERSWKMPVLFLVIVAALAGGAMWWLTQLGVDRAVTRALGSSEARTLQAANGQTGNLTLDDSTKVTLAPGSKLIIPKQFGTEMRAVKIEGAARFAVAPGNPRPFEIRAGDAAIIATGTTIIVRAYPNDKLVTVHLRDGQANVRLGKELTPITAGQTMVVDDHKIRKSTPAEVAEAANWTDRRVTISRQLRDVVAELNRLYGVEIGVPEIKALDRPASVDAPLDSLRVAIAQVEKSAGVTFGYQGQAMVFRTRKDSTKK